MVNTNYTTTCVCQSLILQHDILCLQYNSSLTQKRICLVHVYVLNNDTEILHILGYLIQYPGLLNKGIKRSLLHDGCHKTRCHVIKCTTRLGQEAIRFTYIALNEYRNRIIIMCTTVPNHHYHYNQYVIEPFYRKANVINKIIYRY